MPSATSVGIFASLCLFSMTLFYITGHDHGYKEAHNDALVFNNYKCCERLMDLQAAIRNKGEEEKK